MISIIILGVLALVVTLGLAKPLVKDFGIPAFVLILAHLAVIGLNFIGAITWGAFSFSIGTLVFYVFALAMFVVCKNGKGAIIAFMSALILGGLVYCGIMVSKLINFGFMAENNFVYAIIVGVLAVIFTKNGKYSFIVPAEAMMLVAILGQIGQGGIDLNVGFDWTMLAVLTGSVVYLVAQYIFMAKPDGKMAYYFEAGKLES